MQDIFIGRQPILDRKHDLVAYELSFRSGQTAGANLADDVSATANVIVNSYIDLGVENVLGQQRGFINVTPELLMSDMIHLLPKTQVVLELRPTVETTDEAVRRCDELKQAGYLLALDDVTSVNDKVKLLLPIVSLADEVKSALLTRHGRLGRLLTLLEKKEENDVAAVYRILDELAFLHLGELIAAEMKAVSWAGRIGETVH